MSLSKVWLQLSFIFNPAQKIFNGNFWQIFQSKFQHLAYEKIIDLACGTGELRQYTYPKKYLGVDINASYINFAKKRFQNNRNAKFLLADITDFKIPSEYKTAFFISAAHHLSEWQIQLLCKNVKKSKINQLIIIDGIPTGIFATVLIWLDKILAGGEYFRDENQLVKIFGNYFTILEHGTFQVNFSFYSYPYLIASI